MSRSTRSQRVHRVCRPRAHSSAGERVAQATRRVLVSPFVCRRTRGLLGLSTCRVVIQAGQLACVGVCIRRIGAGCGRDPRAGAHTLVRAAARAPTQPALAARLRLARDVARARLSVSLPLTRSRMAGDVPARATRVTPGHSSETGAPRQELRGRISETGLGTAARSPHGHQSGARGGRRIAT